MKKVLIVCYYWPPAGGPGVQRWLKFATYLKEFELKPIVFIPKNPKYPIVDDSLIAQIPDDLSIITHPIFEPYGLASLFAKKDTKRISSGIIQKDRKQTFLERCLLWVRGNLFIPDARKFWVKPSIRAIKKIIQEENITTVITTGPPHSLHLIGLGLKQQLNIKWIADFRDPWTSIGYHKKLKLIKASRQKHKRLEKTVLTAADQIIATSTTTKREFETLTKKPIAVITNGYDGLYEPTILDTKFTISHIGSLLTDRNPKMLWQVLQELCTENVAFKAKLQIQLAGIVGGGVRESLLKYELLDRVSFLGYVEHQSVLKLQRSAQLLLLLEIDTPETQGIIPGKLFEYLHSRRPILAIGPENWEVARILRETQAGECLEHDMRNALKNVLLKWFTAYQNGLLQNNTTDIKQYSRRELTRKLSEFI